MPDALTPKRIEEQVFAIGERGYDCDEVDAFLKQVAAHVDALVRGETQFGTKPYEALGIEMADLLQHANDVAAHVKKTAEDDAAVILQEAHKEAKSIREQAETVKRKLDAEAAAAKKEATEDAQRLKREAQHVRSLAEAEASLMKQDLRKEAKRLKEEARRRAEAILHSAQSEGKTRAREAELRLRKLQKAETIMKERLAALQEQLSETVEEAEERGVTLHVPPKEEPIELPDFVRFDSRPT
jgi:DivIVA domain-containing protein